MRIINKTYAINSTVNKNIVLISDIHYMDKNDLKKLNNILNHIKKINPDFVCIPGDIINKSYIDDETDFINWLSNLSNICKVIISLGNHEFYIDKYKQLFGLNKELLEKISNINNLYLLDNDNIIIDDINFIGLTIPIECYQNKNNFSKCIKNIKTEKDYYNILLCHSPEHICNYNILKDMDIDLILCGHMHGGVVPNIFRKIFKNRGLVSPNKGLFPKYCYGYLKINNTDIIISSGLRVLPFKLLNKLFRPEIVKINLTIK